MMHLEIMGELLNHAEFSLHVIMLASKEPMIYWEHEVNINECIAIRPTTKLTDKNRTAPVLFVMCADTSEHRC